MSRASSHLNEKNMESRPVSVRIAGYQGWLIQKYDTTDFFDCMRVFLASKLKSQAAFKTSKDCEVYRLSKDGGDIYIKRYFFYRLKQYLQTLLDVNKAQKSCRIGRILIAKGIHTPLPILYIRHKKSFLKSEHIIVTEGIANSMSLRDYVHNHFQSYKQKLSEKRRFIKSVAEFLGNLHLAGIYHGDLTGSNILIERINGPGQVCVHLIDLDSIRSTRRISTRRRLKNLDELGRNFLDLNVIGIYDRAKFLKHYLRTYTKEKRQFRQLFEAIKRRTEYRLIKHGQQFINRG